MEQWVCLTCSCGILFSLHILDIQLTPKQHSLNRVSPYIHGCFSAVNSTVLQRPRLVESADVEELQIKESNCEIYDIQGLTPGCSRVSRSLILP